MNFSLFASSKYKKKRNSFLNNFGGNIVPSASFIALLQKSLIPEQYGGSSTPTFTRASTAYVQDWEGLLKPVLSGEARFIGARRVRNVIPTDISTWSTTANCTITGGQSDPNGGTSAYRITGTGAGYHAQSVQSLRSTDGQVRNSLWIKKVANCAGITMYTGATGSDSLGITSVATTAWQRIATGVKTFTGGGSGYIGVGGIAAGDIIDVFWGQSEDVTGQSNQNPSEYVSVGVLSAPYHGAGVDGVKYFTTTNGNTVASNVVTEAAGVAITSSTPGASSKTTDSYGPLGYLPEGSRTNLCLQSQTFQTTWARGVGMNAPTTDVVVAPDGTTTADTITAIAGASDHRLFQSLSTTNATHTYSIFAKAGGANYVGISFDTALQTANPAGAFFNLSNGTLGTVGAGVTATITAYPNGWYRCTVTSASGGVSPVATVEPFASDNQAFNYNAAGTESVSIWGAQVELASFASSYIPTTTVSVTRAADSLTYVASGNINTSIGTCYAEWTCSASAPGGGIGIINDSTGVAYPLYVSNATKLAAFDGTNVAATANALSLPVSTVQQSASTWGAALTAVTNNGTVASTTFDGTMNTTEIAIGTSPSSLFGTVRNVRIYSRALTTTQIAAIPRPA